jgi:RNA polymerase sigma factor (sigma-70 family)
MTKQQMIEENMKLVYHIIHRYYPTFVNDEDIVQCGMLGLCKAADKWDVEKGEFSTLACKCIRNEILQEFRRRKKHSGVLSLDYEVDDGDGERVPFGDFCVGDKDVQYVGIDSCYDRLTPKQRQVAELKHKGLPNDVIAHKLGVNVQFVWSTLRKLKALWELD